jgi:hypothetical protein
MTAYEVSLSVRLPAHDDRVQGAAVTAALVGPYRRVWFNNREPRYYDLPRDTLDARYEACFDHHPACDCREASLAERVGEHIGEMKSVAAAFDTVLDGHLTRAIPGEVACMCTGCQIARLAHMRHSASRKVREAAQQAAAGHARWAARLHTALYPDEVPFR